MKSVLFALAFAIAISPFTFDPQEDSGKIVGTWKSLDKENGQPSAEVAVKKADDKLTGAVLLRGLVQDGKPVSAEFPMANVMFDGKTLSFKLTFTEAGNKMVTVWELLLRGDEEARFALLTENDAKVEDGPVFVMKRMKAN